ncbi:MAG: hypothetical protein WBE80_11565 [Methylocella sp.]
MYNREKIRTATRSIRPNFCGCIRKPRKPTWTNPRRTIGNSVKPAWKRPPNSAKFEIQLAELKSLIAEKDRRITDLEADRAQLREDRHRLTGNWQEERVRLLELLEDQTGAVTLPADERNKQATEVPRTFWQRVFRRKPAIAA